MSSGPGFLRHLWQRWKALRLPWRKQFLVGADLSGNTFWEFRDQLNANRLRRIVKYPRTPHFADVRISPQWHQWLRHTRHTAPSIQEQQYEVSRQAMMKQLAAEADERWKSQPSYLDPPQRQQPAPAVALEDSAPSAAPAAPAEYRDGREIMSAVGDQEEVAEANKGDDTHVTRERKHHERDKTPAPWDDQPQRGAPSEKWQPDSWIPGVAQRR